MSQKSIITFTFETGKKPTATIFNKYGENDSIKGSGEDLVDLALDNVNDLISNQLSDTVKLARIKVNL